MTKRLGKHEREALRSNRDRKLRLMNVNGRNGYNLYLERKQDSTARISKAYNPDPLTLTAGGRGRLIHNATGADYTAAGRVKRDKQLGRSKTEPLFDKITIAKGSRTPRLGE